MKIQESSEKDIKQITDLALQTPELQDHEGTPSFLSKNILKGYIKSPNDIMLSVFDGEHLIGFLICQFNPYTKVAYLEDLVINKVYRGNGLGDQLFNMLKQRLKEKNCIDIWGLVDEENDVMLQFLKNRGFKKGRKFYLLDRDF